MKLLLSATLLFILSSCAHHHKDKPHHHHECTKACKLHKEGKAYNKRCAKSVSMGDTHVEGKEDYKINHGGVTYYFSTKKKMKDFKKDLKKNIESADKVWVERAGGRI